MNQWPFQNAPQGQSEKASKEPEDDIESQDLDSLKIAFNDLISRCQAQTNDAYSSIYPIIHDLTGGSGNAQDIGNVGNLRMALKDTRLLRTDTGRLMWETLKMIEDLQGWQTRYSLQLEKFFDSIVKVCNGTFRIIDELQDDNEKLNLQIRDLHEQIATMIPQQTTQETPSGNPRFVKDIEPLTRQDIIELRPRFEMKFAEYKAAYFRGENQKLGLFKGNIIRLGQRHPEKKEILNKWFDEEMINIPNSDGKQPVHTKSNENLGQIYSPYDQSRKNSSEENAPINTENLNSTTESGDNDQNNQATIKTFNQNSNNPSEDN